MRTSILALLVTLGFATSALAGPKVLICANDAMTGGIVDVQTKLKASMAFAAVDTVDCGAQTPTLAALKMYEAVLVFDSTPYSDATSLGNNLADYVDAGGGVVSMMFDQVSGMQGLGGPLLGRWQAGSYDCIIPGMLPPPLPMGTPLTMMPNDPQSPLVQGVTGIASIYVAGNGVNNKWGAVSVWDYQGKQPGVCKMMINGHPRVDLNFFPGPPPKFYTESKAGDGATLIKNALIYVSGGFNPMKGMPNPAAFPDTGTGAVSNPITITFTNSSMMAQTVNAAMVGGANPADFLLVKSPQLPVVVGQGGTVSFDVVFQPVNAGGRQAVLQIGVAGQMSTGDVSLTGNAILSSVKVSPYPIAMGGTQQGMPVMKDVTIANTGMNKVNILNVSITMGQAAYTLSGGVGFPVALIGGGSFPMTVTFAPQMNGISNGILTVTSDDPNTPTINVPISGYAGPPAITLDANSIAFGNVNLGATSPQVVNITNSGFSDLNVTDISVGGANPGDFPVAKMMAIGILGAQQTVPFTISFAPAQLGQRSATVTVSSNAGNKTVSVFGAGTMSMLSLAPNALSFAPTHVKTTSAPQMLTVSNAGNGTLKVSALTFGGMDATSFKQMGMPSVPFSVGPNAMVQVPLVCVPQIFGKVKGTLTVVTDVGSGMVALDGEGTAPVFSIAPASVDFGAVPVLTKSMAKAITVTNMGTDSLTFSMNIAGPDGGDFSSMDQPQGPTVLMPMASTTFHVILTPSKNGVETGEIDFITDDPGNLQPKIALTGNGTQAGITVNLMTVDFMTVPIGTAATPKALIVKNTGDVPVTINTITLGGAGQSQFSADMKGPIMIDKGASATIMIGFSPLTMGLIKATLTLTPVMLVPVTINLQGIGAGPSLTVAPLTLDFGPLDVGMTSDAQTVGIKNGGNAAVMLEPITSADPAFTIDQSGTMPMLAPGMQTTFTVKFAPTEQKMYGAKISVTLKGQSNPIAQVTASGTGTVATSRGGCGCVLGARRPVGGAFLFVAAMFLVQLARRRRYTDQKGF